MNSPHLSQSRITRRTRRIAAAAGALGMTTALAASFLGGGISETEAAWNDTEVASATIKAEWPNTAFASVIAGSAVSSDSAINNDNMTYQYVYRKTQIAGNHTPPPIPVRTGSWITTDLDEEFHEYGTKVSPAAQSDGNLTRDRYNNSIHNWNAVTDFRTPTLGNPRQTYPYTTYCTGIDFTNETNHCNQTDGQQNPVALASNNTNSFGFSMASSNGTITFLNSANLSTSVQCGTDWAYAQPPTGRVDIGAEFGGTDPYLSYGIYSARARTIWSNGSQGRLDLFDLDSGEISDMWEIGGGDPWARAMPIITQHSSQAGESPYAISEIGVYVELFNRYITRDDETRLKMYLVLSRSECGVKVGDAELPTQRDVFPAELPGGNGLDPYDPEQDGIFQPAMQQAQPLVSRGMQQSESTNSDLPSGTTVTSPTEHTTVSETTTSAPPSPPDDADTSASTGSRSPSTKNSSTPAPTPVTSASPTKKTSTSKTTTQVRTSTSTPAAESTTTETSTAAPEVVIPDEPGELSPTARIEDVETITVDEDELDVVVVGNEVPTDARGGAAALEIWLAGGNPSSTWETFASGDPDEDGWRWAAINQKTGTVVYIR